MHAAALRYVDQVARHRSIRKASARLNVASSAVNRQILKLERELGMPLFVRRRDGVQPTAAGELLLSHVRGTLVGFDRTRAEIDELRGLKTGHVRLVALDSLMVEFLPRLIEAMVRRYPGISFTMMAAGPRDVTEELRAGRADIAVSFVDRRARDIEVIAAHVTRLGAVVSPQHPLARQRQVTLAECARFPTIMVHDTLPLTGLIEREFAERGTLIAPRVVSNSLEFMRSVLRMGLGVGFFTPLGFAREIRRRELVLVPLAEPRLSRIAIGAMVRRGEAHTPAAQVTIEELAKSFAVLRDATAGSVTRRRRAA